MRISRTLGVLAAAALALGACSTVSKIGELSPFHSKAKETAKARGTRIPVIALNDQLKVADALKGQDFQIPPPQPVAEWPLPGGTPAQSVEHVEAGEAFVIAWRRPIGAASSKKLHVTAPPVGAAGRIFVMDGGATVSAYDARTGARVWRTDVMPRSKRNHEAWGGGLAWGDGKLYVSSGYREVVQLDAATGALGWRTAVEAPIHAAPTVFGGRVFVVDVNDELLAFDAATGGVDWTYQALTEPARILEASSPAVDNQTVVASFASGELVAVRSENGNELWNASLSKASRTNALSEIRDIAGRPVIFQSDVFAVSHSDVFAAVDLRTGAPRWTLPVSAITTPWPAGDVVYVVDQAGQVLCASRESGQLYWIRDLNQGLKKKARAIWSSPILASNRLITISDKGEAIALNPKTGATIGTLKVGGDTLIGPIAMGGMLYVVTETAQLVAIR
ncbi:MAG: PQQ-binding-like beta-propeller repeat protein [Caulobacteraceae bacterium]